MKRLNITIEGFIQGVGFRPFVVGIAKQLKLTGWVVNNGGCVSIEIQGEKVLRFEALLKDTLKPPMQIVSLKTKSLEVIPHESDFYIKKSVEKKSVTHFIPDLAICKHCLDELFDRESRYFLYPFINCTACGPRFSITKKLPYDRFQTTMNEFNMCEACAKEYDDPNDRRYHAQPVACAKCGPDFDFPLSQAAKLIENGKIIALKALGGYQLICDAQQTKVITELRVRKNRPTKPFAIMFLNIESIRKKYHCNDQEAKELLSPAHPIVLLRLKKTEHDLIAPGLNYHGVMLPYTGIHYLLFYYLLNEAEGVAWLDQPQELTLVVTSGNNKGSAIISNDNEAGKILDNIAHKVISHNRHIYLPIDDSIVKYIHDKPQLIRRARGFVPKVIKFKNKGHSILALGCHLKNTICLTKNDNAYVSQYLGTMNTASTIDFMKACLDHFRQFFHIDIQHIVHDAHPDIFTTQLAHSFQLPTIAVQHHHAHVASVMAEHQLDGPVLAWVLDGFGYAGPKQVWGGELLWVHGANMKKVLSLKPYVLPGGDQAAKEPWRMALSVLSGLIKEDVIKNRFSHQPQVEKINELLKQNVFSLYSSACGRYFDAASAILGICDLNTYEGEAAMKLESLVTNPKIYPNGWCVKNGYLDFSALWEQLLYTPTIEGANLFHGTLAQALAETAYEQLQSLGINRLVITGGCAQNKVLIETMLNYLKNKKIQFFMAEQLPPNDGGLCLGQAWIANALINEKMLCV